MPEAGAPEFEAEADRLFVDAVHKSGQPDGAKICAALASTNPTHALQWAAWQGNEEETRQALSSGDPSANGHRALYWAVRQGHAPVVGVLLSALEAAKDGGVGRVLESCLNTAAREGHAEVLELIIPAARPHMAHRPQNASPVMGPLLTAVAWENLAAVKVLLSHPEYQHLEMVADALKGAVQNPLRSHQGMVDLLAQALPEEEVVKVWDDLRSQLDTTEVATPHSELDVLARWVDGRRLKTYWHQIEEAAQTQKVGAWVGMELKEIIPNTWAGLERHAAEEVGKELSEAIGPALCGALPGRRPRI